MPESKPKSEKNSNEMAKEPPLKTIGVVCITLVALVFLIIRPLLDLDGENNESNAVSDQSKELSGEKSEAANQKSDGQNNESTSQSKSNPKKLDGAKKQSNANKKTSEEKSKVKDDSLPQKTTAKSKGPRGPPKSKTQGFSAKNFSGKLTKVSDTIFKSEAGLIYGPGSREGHRLDHVLQHAKDNLSKPVHGVFDGSKNEILALIDQAYDRIKKNHRSVSSSKSGKRNSHSVYFGKRIGYVGGKSGKQKKNPIAKTLVLVLEDNNRVITAFPK